MARRAVCGMALLAVYLLAVACGPVGDEENPSDANATLSGFPSTPVLAGFNRTNGALGANWVALTRSRGSAPVTVVSNRASVGSGANGWGSVHRAAQFGPSQ